MYEFVCLSICFILLESPHRFDEREVNIHYKTPIQQLVKSSDHFNEDDLVKFQRDVVCLIFNCSIIIYIYIFFEKRTKILLYSHLINISKSRSVRKSSYLFHFIRSHVLPYPKERLCEEKKISHTFKNCYFEEEEKNFISCLTFDYLFSRIRTFSNSLFSLYKPFFFFSLLKSLSYISHSFVL